MKILAIDLGEVRVGFAESDALGITAQGLESYYIKDHEDLIRHVQDIRDRDEIAEIVIGLPLNMDGSEGKKAIEARDFAAKLNSALGVPVHLWDERLTTAAVQRVMIHANTSRQKRKNKIDKLAAQLILQGYLDSRRSVPEE